MQTPATPQHKIAPLTEALDQSERVQDKVEQAALDLSSVNAVLKAEIAEGVPLVKVELALKESELIEAKVQEAADDLVAVNDALALEIDERHRLEDRLSESAAALSESTSALSESAAALFESRTKERRSRHNSLHDAATGLANLTLFSDRLGHGIAQAQRHGWRLAVMFVDLDDFKSINDLHGHDVGDRTLRLIAKRLKMAVRSGDTVCRRSGDEFLILMLEAKNQANVVMFASRIMENIAASCEIDGVTLTVTASVGIALYPEDGCSAEELLKKADMAMYSAKQHKNGPVLHAGGAA